MMKEMGMTIEEMLIDYYKIFDGHGDIRGYFAPGRVNLIGEHIDYNGGHVFPCAITAGNYIIARKRNDDKLRFYSANFSKFGIINSSLQDLVFHKDAYWTNYLKGVMWAFGQKGFPISDGFDIYVYGNIPGSGLSSSAALEVATGCMLADFFNIPLSMTDIALLGQLAENKFNNMNCGIMDQYASANGKKGQAMYLNTSNLECEYIPLNLHGCKIVVTNSNKPHSLTSSHYNDRRQECEEALKDLQKEVNIQALCQLSPEDFEKYKHLIRRYECLLRATHAIFEEARTKEAVNALKRDDLKAFGKLLNESGDSLRYQYDATCFEIDTLVDEARQQKGVYGSRETGGGWGGNIISIVENDYIDDFIENVGANYYKKVGLKADFVILEPSDGGRRLF